MMEDIETPVAGQIPETDKKSNKLPSVGLLSSDKKQIHFLIVSSLRDAVTFFDWSFGLIV